MKAIVFVGLIVSMIGSALAEGGGGGCGSKNNGENCTSAGQCKSCKCQSGKCAA